MYTKMYTLFDYKNAVNFPNDNNKIHYTDLCTNDAR